MGIPHDDTNLQQSRPDRVGSGSELLANPSERPAGPVEVGRCWHIIGMKPWWLGIDTSGAQVLARRDPVDAEPGSQVIHAGTGFVSRHQLDYLGEAKLPHRSIWGLSGNPVRQTLRPGLGQFQEPSGGAGRV
jgi:hypothetical protein